jgi:hypothetical protein
MFFIKILLFRHTPLENDLLVQRRLNTPNFKKNFTKVPQFVSDMKPNTALYRHHESSKLGFNLRSKFIFVKKAFYSAATSKIKKLDFCSFLPPNLATARVFQSPDLHHTPTSDEYCSIHAAASRMLIEACRYVK